MSENYYYTPVSLNSISNALTKSLAGMGQGEDSFLRAGTINTIFAVPGDANASDVEDLILTLSMAHPNRTFVLMFDENKTGVTADFSARCHSVSKHEHVCSEVIRLHAPISQLASVLSVIRANLLTGLPTELYLYDSKIGLETLSSLSALSECLVFQSNIFEENFLKAKELLKRNNTLIDLEWVRIGGWREQIKDLCENPILLESIKNLSRITLGYVSTSSNSGVASSALLFAGWFISRLGGVVTERKEKEIEVTLSNSKNFSVVFQKLSQDLASNLSSIKIEISKNPSHEAGVIELTRNLSQLSTNVELGDFLFRTRRPLEEENRASLMKKYFFIGESILNYEESLRGALALSQKLMS